jgi:hypothetical protein
VPHHGGATGWLKRTVERFLPGDHHKAEGEVGALFTARREECMRPVLIPADISVIAPRLRKASHRHRALPTQPVRAPSPPARTS